jgi:hypothetical protein
MLRFVAVPLLEGISELVSDLREAEKIVFLIFSTKRQPNIKDTICAFAKSTDLIFRTLKQLFLS